MAYNASLYNPYGQMYNPYNPQQYQTSNQSSQQQLIGMQWVDGEVGAKAFQLPVGWDINKPLPLWDSNDQVIYLKSMNQMGIPNPIQKLRYQIEGQQMSYEGSLREPQSQKLVAGRIGDEPEPVENSHGLEAFATKKDLEKMRQEIVQAIQDGQSQPQSNTVEKKGAKTREPSV